MVECQTLRYQMELEMVWEEGEGERQGASQAYLFIFGETVITS
ncbi:MAG: hypothetical protein RLP02_06940 [Coleofasciculus sp. C2-GNP5-27]